MNLHTRGRGGTSIGDKVSHGLSAHRKLLLVGPPGCGKTMTASALAGELNLPLLSVRLDGLITKPWSICVSRWCASSSQSPAGGVTAHDSPTVPFVPANPALRGLAGGRTLDRDCGRLGGIVRGR